MNTILHREVITLGTNRLQRFKELVKLVELVMSKIP